MSIMRSVLRSVTYEMYASAKSEPTNPIGIVQHINDQELNARSIVTIMLDTRSLGQGLTLLAVISAIPILYHLFRTNKHRNGHPYPPGPKGNFLLGNLLDMPTFKPWLSYVKMGKQYDSKCSTFVW